MNPVLTESKFIGAIKFSAIGDALGWMTEFQKSESSIEKTFGTKKICQFYDWSKINGGRFYAWEDHIAAGEYSDDTQMMLAVARSFDRNGSLNHEYFAKKELPQWLGYARGAGRTVKTAAQKIQRKKTRWNTNFYTISADGFKIDYRDCGANGVAMRILPIVLANVGDFKTIKSEIFANGIVTHGHPRALVGGILYGFALNQMLLCSPKDFTWSDLLTNIGKNLTVEFNLDFIEDNEALQEWATKWNETGRSFRTEYFQCLEEVLQQLRFIFKSLKHNTPIQDVLSSLGCKVAETKSSGTATVVAGLYLACRYANAPLEGVFSAVNSLETDTDSIAAFVGGLLGSLYGKEIIPLSLQNIQDGDCLEKLGASLFNRQFPLCFNLTGIDLDSFVVNHSWRINDKIELLALGKGTITSIGYVNTVHKDKTTLILKICLNSGQTIQISKLLERNQTVNSLDPNSNSKLDSLSLFEKYQF